MSFDYSDRDVPIAFVGSVARGLASDGTMLVNAEVQFILSDKVGGILGPKVRVSISIPDENGTLQETELEFLAAAHAVLKRLAVEPDSKLPLALEDNRKKANWAPPPA